MVISECPDDAGLSSLSGGKNFYDVFIEAKEANNNSRTEKAFGTKVVLLEYIVSKETSVHTCILLYFNLFIIHIRIATQSRRIEVQT